MRALIQLALSGLLGLTASSVAAQTLQQTRHVVLAINNVDRYGPHLADAANRSLYMFTADQQATGNMPAVSRCNDACAEVWPPVITTQPVRTETGVDDKLIGTVQRPDGSTQLTFGGWPVYYYLRDQKVGYIGGQGVNEFGGLWYLLSPSGEPMKSIPKQ